MIANWGKVRLGTKEQGKRKRTHRHRQQCGDCSREGEIRRLNGNGRNTIKIPKKPPSVVLLICHLFNYLMEVSETQGLFLLPTVIQKPMIVFIPWLNQLPGIWDPLLDLLDQGGRHRKRDRAWRWLRRFWVAMDRSVPR